MLPPPLDAFPSTDAEAARFVLQAQFSVSDADITALKSGGLLAWLNARTTNRWGRPAQPGSTPEAATPSLSRTP